MCWEIVQRRGNSSSLNTLSTFSETQLRRHVNPENTKLLVGKCVFSSTGQRIWICAYLGTKEFSRVVRRIRSGCFVNAGAGVWGDIGIAGISSFQCLLQSIKCICAWVCWHILFKVEYLSSGVGNIIGAKFLEDFCSVHIKSPKVLFVFWLRHFLFRNLY